MKTNAYFTFHDLWYNEYPYVQQCVLCVAVRLHFCANFKCFINDFFSILGLEMEGIYRLSGQHSKITQLLKLLLEGIIIY